MTGGENVPFLQKNQTRIFYKKEPVNHSNKVETIVLIHTNITNHTIYDKMIPFLNEEFRLIRYDLRGFGLSDLGDEQISIDLYVDDLQFLIKSLNLEPVHLVGFGFGALLALKFSTLHSNLVKKMALMTMACFPEETYDSVKAHRSKVSYNGTKIPVDSILKKVTSLTTDDPEYTRIHQMMSNVPTSTRSE